MANKVGHKKRVQVLLQPDVHAIVEEISQLGGVSIGGLLGEMIAENKQGLEMIRDALIAAKNQDASGAIQKIQSMLSDSMANGAELNKEMDKFLADRK